MTWSFGAIAVSTIILLFGLIPGQSVWLFVSLWWMMIAIYLKEMK